MAESLRGDITMFGVHLIGQGYSAEQIAIRMVAKFGVDLDYALSHHVPMSIAVVSATEKANTIPGEDPLLWATGPNFPERPELIVDFLAVESIGKIGGKKKLIRLSIPLETTKENAIAEAETQVAIWNIMYPRHLLVLDPTIRLLY